MRADNNQESIVKALRACGATVHITNQVGGGFPDIAVGIFGKNYLMEVKNKWNNYEQANFNDFVLWCIHTKQGQAFIRKVMRV